MLEKFKTLNSSIKLAMVADSKVSDFIDKLAETDISEEIKNIAIGATIDMASDIIATASSGYLSEEIVSTGAKLYMAFNAVSAFNKVQESSGKAGKKTEIISIE